MTVEERIGAADRRKMDGNALFQEEKLEEAMQQYEMVIHLYFFCSSIQSSLFLIYENSFSSLFCFGFDKCLTVFILVRP